MKLNISRTNMEKLLKLENVPLLKCVWLTCHWQNDPFSPNISSLNVYEPHISHRGLNSAKPCWTSSCIFTACVSITVGSSGCPRSHHPHPQCHLEPQFTWDMKQNQISLVTDLLITDHLFVAPRPLLPCWQIFLPMQHVQVLMNWRHLWHLQEQKSQGCSYIF